MQDGAEPLGSLGPEGIANGMRLSLMRCLARVIRRVIVAFGHEKRPSDLGGGQPADRAQREGDLGGRRQRRVAAHEQQDQRVVRLRRDAAPTGGAVQSSGSAQRATVSSRRCRACSLRSRSVSRREATVISQARGSSGMPSRGHCAAAASNASWTASSAVSKCP